MFTIGICDFNPRIYPVRGPSVPVAIGGIIFVGLTVASISALMLDQGPTKMSVRLVGRARQKLSTRIGSKTVAVGLYPSKRPKLACNEASELERREQGFNVMRKLQHTASIYDRLFAFCVSLGIVIVIILWFTGAVAFGQGEERF